jgi:hypothetical protein
MVKLNGDLITNVMKILDHYVAIIHRCTYILSIVHEKDSESTVHSRDKRPVYMTVQ